MSKFEFKEKDRKYSDVTGEIFTEDCAGADIPTVFRQIAYNIAHLADEVRALRKDLTAYSNANGLMYVNKDERDKDSERHSENGERHKDEREKKEKCVYCGKPLDIKDAGTTIVLYDQTFCVCKDCNDKKLREFTSFIRSLDD